MPSGAAGRFTRLMRGITKTFSSCSLRMSAGESEQIREPSPAPVISPDHHSTSSDLLFSPSPIDTGNMVLPDSVIALQSTVSENLHEVWSLNKIEAGWVFGEQRDDMAKKHPCLTDFSHLTETEKSYDVILTMETFKTLAALGYDPLPCPVNLNRRPPLLDLPESYRQSNGYKPSPFDLSSIKLSPELEDLIDALAANLHDIWAKNRIAEGWRYGNSEDNSCKRSPNLVPYDKIDWTIKKANRESVQTLVKSLLAFGSDLRSKKPSEPYEKPGSQQFHTMHSSDSTSGDNMFLRP